MKTDTLKGLKRTIVYFALCCIGVGTVLCILAIWEMVEGEVFWRSIATMAVLFTSSLAMLLVVILTRPILLGEQVNHSNPPPIPPTPAPA